MSSFKAINYWVLGGFDGQKGPYKAIEDAAAMGLDGLEITVGDCIGIDTSEAECRKIAGMAKNAGIGLRTLATGFYWGCSMASGNREERLRALDFTRKYLRLASWLGAESVLVVPGAVDVAWDSSRGVASYREVWERSSESLRELLPTAREFGVNIAIENVWNKFLLSPMEMKSYVDQFADPALGVYFDTGNCMISGYPEHWIETLGKRVKAVHVKNFRRENAGGTLAGFGDDLTAGDLDFAAVAAALKLHAPEAPLTVEMIPFSRLPELGLPDMELARDCAAKLKRLFD